MEKEIIPCVCMTCGIRNDFSTDNGYCQNGHDNWLEYRDLLHNPELFVDTAERAGLSFGDFVNQFRDTSIKQFQLTPY